MRGQAKTRDKGCRGVRSVVYMRSRRKLGAKRECRRGVGHSVILEERREDGGRTRIASEDRLLRTREIAFIFGFIFGRQKVARAARANGRASTDLLEPKDRIPFLEISLSTKYAVLPRSRSGNAADAPSQTSTGSFCRAPLFPFARPAQCHGCAVL